MNKIALGGGCHWCTEAVFQHLKGVELVEQGYVASTGINASFSEAVIVTFDETIISLKTLVEVHLYTHKSAVYHSMRDKYRSAVYVFSQEQKAECISILKMLQKTFKIQLITKILEFSKFRPSRESIQNYYQNNPNKPFCKTFINPKLQLIFSQYSEYINTNNLKQLI
ncbi:peptide-methionine (S)-S-oxide reductase [uncultured Psychroserpens sp.]|uniref:peptide-methionine (S)-S-oxide reductase n=1 Tax=uncultured Psychroserpens sp. TaxID=255436 RepID=UPI0026040F8A|nr:peptide-methionine (S)-S-oxide reductase [uncultured Psychroserpens sp.]